MKQLTLEAKTLVASTGAAAGTSDVTSSVIDRADFEQIRFAAVLGDVTTGCVLTLKAQTGNLANGSDMADVSGCATAAFTADGTSADNKVITLDVIKPVKRYVRVVLSRTTANAVVNNILADLYHARQTPVTSSDVIATAAKQG